MRLMGARTLLSHSFRIAWKDVLELYRNKLGLVLLIVMPAVHDGDGRFHLSDEW